VAAVAYVMESASSNAERRPDLSVCILSWNTEWLLYRCLSSIFRPEDEDVAAAMARAGLPHCSGADRIELEVIVVDNASSDGSADMVERDFPGVKLVRSSQNLGFPGGNNLGYRHAGGRYFLLLNSDTVVPKGTFTALVEYADTDPRAGLIGPRVLNPDGTLQMSCRRFPSLGAGLFRNTPLGRLFPNNRFTRDYLMTDFKHDEVCEVDWLSGCALMARREMIEQVGLLDETFFMYCEDVDWAYRARAAGWRNLYVPSASLIHEIGRSTDKAVNRMIIQFHRSMYHFFLKHYAATANPAVRLLVLGGLTARAGLMLTRNQSLRLKILWLNAVKNLLGRRP
jgi:GT2 family glycosyltransferase